MYIYTPWVGAVLDGFLPVLPPSEAVIDDLHLRLHSKRNPLRSRPLYLGPDHIYYIYIYIFPQNASDIKKIIIIIIKLR